MGIVLLRGVLAIANWHCLESPRLQVSFINKRLMGRRLTTYHDASPETFESTFYVFRATADSNNTSEALVPHAS